MRHGGDGEGLARLAGGDRFALKVVHPHLLETPGFFKPFLREAEIGQAVSHPNVVRCFDCDQLVVDGTTHAFLVMEYVEEEPRRLGERSPQVSAFFEEVVHALLAKDRKERFASGSKLLADGEDLNFLFGSFPPGGAATASGAWSTACREQFGAEGLEETLGEYLTVTPILIPAFAAILRGEPPPEGKEPLTRDSLQTVFVHSTQALAKRRPTVVLIEDLHFAPEEGRETMIANVSLHREIMEAWEQRQGS